MSLAFVTCGAGSSPAAAQPLPACEWCGAAEAPDSVGASATIAGTEEPGPRLVLTGTVYQPDGATPAPGVLLYAYHTNAEGVYPKRGTETGNARRHGHLRGWVRTDAEGRYELRTIRPASYPDSRVPAHVHMTVRAPGAEEAWIDAVQFDDDPLLTPAIRASQEDRGGSGIVVPVQAEDGTWHAVRDIVLPD